ncbi:unnamed protein product [Linum tenue]|uniref:F-box associated domain-containing protein n=1 Tax=Linum tenue TaxID=586396 RepID=A0AAV0NWT0_9ROSI|nr:unnamed protein product [Linum tenue]
MSSDSNVASPARKNPRRRWWDSGIVSGSKKKVTVALMGRRNNKTAASYDNNTNPAGIRTATVTVAPSSDFRGKFTSMGLAVVDSKLYAFGGREFNTSPNGNDDSDSDGVSGLSAPCEVLNLNDLSTQTLDPPLEMWDPQLILRYDTLPDYLGHVVVGDELIVYMHTFVGSSVFALHMEQLKWRRIMTEYADHDDISPMVPNLLLMMYPWDRLPEAFCSNLVHNGAGSSPVRDGGGDVYCLVLWWGVNTWELRSQFKVCKFRLVDDDGGCEILDTVEDFSAFSQDFASSRVTAFTTTSYIGL